MKNELQLQGSDLRDLLLHCDSFDAAVGRVMKAHSARALRKEVAARCLFPRRTKRDAAETLLIFEMHREEPTALQKAFRELLDSTDYIYQWPPPSRRKQKTK